MGLKTRPPVDRHLEEQAIGDLRRAGFVLLQREVRLLSSATKHGASMMADIVAWATGDDGELRPQVLVEVKRVDMVRESGLRQLASYADLLGVRETFVFDGMWHRVSSDFTAVEDAEAPAPMSTAEPRTVPEHFLRREFPLEVWRWLDRQRAEGPFTDALVRVARQLSSWEKRDELLPQLLHLRAARGMLAEMVFEQVVPRDATTGPWTLPWGVATAMARLLAPRSNDRIVDPFAGLGTLLFASAAEARSRDRAGEPTLVGIERNEHVAELMGALCSLVGEDINFWREDSLHGDRPLRSRRVISMPPLNMKLQEKRALSSGSAAADGNLAHLDTLVRCLEPGGRLVALVAPKVLFDSSPAAVGFRRHLAEQFNVAAVVGLPGGALSPTTAMRSAILVIENRPAVGRASLVADLSADWRAQLSEDGEFLAAYRQHVGDEP